MTFPKGTQAPLDVARIRSDFPILQRKVYGKRLIYLDNAATSQKPRSVIQALTDYYECYNSNVHRGVHALSMEATDQYEQARQKVASFIGAPSPESIVFVRNTTEAINLVANTWALANIDSGDEILLTELEHHSNLVPWQKVAKDKGARLRFIPMAENYTLDLSSLNDLLTSRTRLVALGHMSNALGTINPVQEITRRAHEVGAKVLVDGAQSVPHLPTDVRALDCDFLAFSSHKMLGPTGIGVLYGKMDVLEDMDVFLRGGDMVKEVWYDRATWNDIPARFEAGTPNIADTIAFGAAIDYLQNIGMETIRHHEEQLIRYTLNSLKPLEDDLQIYGPSDISVRGGIVSFHSPQVHPHDLGTVLDRQGIAIRSGHHCAMPLMRRMGVPATARASFHLYNEEWEIDALVDGLKQALRFFNHATRKSQL